MYACMYVCMYVCMNVCMYVHMCVLLCICRSYEEPHPAFAAEVHNCGRTKIMINLRQAGRTGVKQALKQCWEASETAASVTVKYCY